MFEHLGHYVWKWKPLKQYFCKIPSVPSWLFSVKFPVVVYREKNYTKCVFDQLRLSRSKSIEMASNIEAPKLIEYPS